MTYFKDVTTLEELRRQYKELLKQYHPDTPNGSTEATQQINIEYEVLFNRLKNSHESKQTKTDNEKSDFNKMKWDFAEDTALREMLQKIINLSDITIEICGAWIWIFGNTYQHREVLKEYGFKFGSTKKAWYWHSEAFRKRSHKTLSMNDIRNYYGSTQVHAEDKKLLKEA